MNREVLISMLFSCLKNILLCVCAYGIAVDECSFVGGAGPISFPFMYRYFLNHLASCYLVIINSLTVEIEESGWSYGSGLFLGKTLPSVFLTALVCKLVLSEFNAGGI